VIALVAFAVLALVALAVGPKLSVATAVLGLIVTFVLFAWKRRRHTIYVQFDDGSLPAVSLGVPFRRSMNWGPQPAVFSRIIGVQKPEFTF